MDTAECAQLKAAFTASDKSWKFESEDFLTTPVMNGQSPADPAPIYRAYNPGFAGASNPAGRPLVQRLGLPDNRLIAGPKPGSHSVINEPRERQMIKRFLVLIAGLTMFACAAPGEISATRKPQVCDGTGICKVDIINPRCSIFGKCTADVEQDPLTFKRTKNDIKIQWELPPGYAFCAAGTGDGVFLKSGDEHDQFKDPGLEGENGHDLCKFKKYKWTARNTVINLRYPYKIQFHDAAGKTSYLVDPVMINE